MENIKIGLIGAWGLRGAVVRHALNEPNIEIVMAADRYTDCLQKCEEYYKKLGQNVETTLDYHSLLARKDIDAVFVLTPDYLHKEHAIAALRAGKSVYLEKPMAIHLKDCDEILATAYETKSKLFLGHNMRYFPAILKMKEIIDSGIIGEVQSVWCRHFVSYGGEAYFKDWHSEQRYSNGLLLQKAAHDIDVIHWLAGAYTKRVVGMGKLSVYDKNKNRQAENLPEEQRYFPLRKGIEYPPAAATELAHTIDIEDHSMIFMQLENGVQASYMHSMYTPTSERNYTIIGTKGKLENIGDFGDCEIHVYTELCEYRQPNIIHKLKAVSGEHGGADPQIIRAFIRFIRDGIAPNTSPIAARMSVACGIAGTQSIREQNKALDIAPLDKKIEEYFLNGQR